MAEGLQTGSNNVSVASRSKESGLVRLANLRNPVAAISTEFRVVEVAKPSDLTNVTLLASSKSKLSISENGGEIIFVARGPDFTLFVVDQKNQSNVQFTDTGSGNVNVTYSVGGGEKDANLLTLSIPRIGSLDIKASSFNKTCPTPVGNPDQGGVNDYCEAVAISGNGQIVGSSQRDTTAGEIFDFRDGSLITWAPGPENKNGVVKASYHTTTMQPDRVYGDEIYPIAINNAGAIIANRKEFNPTDSIEDERDTGIYISPGGGEYPVLIDGKPARSSIQFSPKGTVALFKAQDGKIAVVETLYDKPGNATLLSTPGVLIIPNDSPVNVLSGARAQITSVHPRGFGTSSVNHAFAGEYRSHIFGEGFVTYTTVRGEVFKNIPQGLSWALNERTGQYEFEGLVKPLAQTSSNVSIVNIPGGAAASISDPKYGEITFHNYSLSLEPSESQKRSAGVSVFIKGAKYSIDLNRVLFESGVFSERFKALVEAVQINQDIFLVLKGESDRCYFLRKNAAAFWEKAREESGLNPIR
jgi:hypothetical protein